MLFSPATPNTELFVLDPAILRSYPYTDVPSLPSYFSSRPCFSCLSNAKYAYRTSIAGAGSRIITLPNRHKEVNSWYDSWVGRHLSRPVRLTYGNIRRGWSKISKRGVATWEGKGFHVRSYLSSVPLALRQIYTLVSPRHLLAQTVDVYSQ